MPIKIEGLTKHFSTLSVFNNFDIHITDKKITCILGPSGCGKTTLLNIISGLVKPDSGSLSGFDTQSISYIFQEPRLLNWMSVWNNIDFVLKDIYPRAYRNEIIKEYLSMVNLYDFKDYHPNKLSGGMKQRVSIARAFVYPSKLLIMDEPFKGLDNKLKYSLIEDFLQLWFKNERTVIFVTHDIDEALLLSDEIFILDSNPAKIKDHIYIDTPKQGRKIIINELKTFYKDFLC